MGKLPTSSPKPEPEQKKLVEDLKGKEKQSNASSLEPETKPDQLVIPAPVIAHSVVMQEHMSNEEYRSWKEVLENPEDFEAWVKLLALAEKHVSFLKANALTNHYNTHVLSLGKSSRH